MTQTAGGGTATDQAREKAQEVSSQAKEKAQEAGAQARSRVRDEVDRRSTQAGDQAGSTAQALREASSRLREEGNEPIAKGLEQVADRVERAGGWLRDSDGDSILREVEDFGRRNSLAVMAGGLVVGFAASRLLKASSRRRYESSASRTAGAYDGDNGATGHRHVPPDTGLGATGPGVAPDTRVGAADPGVARSAPVPPREGLTESGLSGGTPATTPPTWQGGEGERAPRP
jgi:hypothetical protein